MSCGPYLLNGDGERLQTSERCRWVDRGRLQITLRPNMRLYVRAANITWAGWDFSDVKEMNFDERGLRSFQLKRGMF